MVVRKLGVFIIPALVIVLLVGCGQASKERGRYSRRLEKFSVQLPAGWRSVIPASGVLVSVQNLERTVTINISADKVAYGYTNEKARQHLNSEGQISDIFYGESGDIPISGKPGHWLKGISGNQRFTSILYFVIHFNHLYSIQFITLSDQFDSYKDQFENIIQSFKFE
ncbi:MAG: hypothetical protein WC478_01535 [Candidatus Omnitrophota bacterium]